MSVEPTRIGRAAAQPTGLKLAVYRGSVGVSVRYNLVNDSGTRGLPLHAYVCSIQPSGHGQRTRRAGGSNHGCSALPVAFCSGELHQPLINLEPHCYWHMAQLWSIAWCNCHCHELRSSAVSPNRENLVDMPEPPRLWSSINNRHSTKFCCSAGGSAIVSRFDNRPPRQVARRRSSWSRCTSIRALRVHKRGLYSESAPSPSSSCK